MAVDSSPPRPLDILVLPFIMPSHFLPLFDMARLFASRGQRVTFITIPPIAASLQSTVDDHVSAGHPLSLHLIDQPPEALGIENLHRVTDIPTAVKLQTGFNSLRPQFESLIRTRKPDCIIADMFFPWTTKLAAELNIPRLHFHVSCLFSITLEKTLGKPDAPHWKVKTDDEPFLIPDLPDPITMIRSQLNMDARDPNRAKDFRNELVAQEFDSYAFLVNSFYELEPAYTEHYKTVLGGRVKICNIGPGNLIRRTSAVKSDHVVKSSAVAVGKIDFAAWLDSKRESSVLYICFGSTCTFPDEQLTELASALDSAGPSFNFIWVVHGKSDREWLPEGFEERNRDRGMVVQEWVPQVQILNHPAVGGFMTHCGWGSLSEAVSAGLPLLTWPIHCEQFYNEKLVSQVLGIGVEVGAEEWNWYSFGKRIIKRGKIEAAVRKLMVDGERDEEVKKMREKARKLAEMAKAAMEEGGSSHRTLTELIEDLKNIRDHKVFHS